MGFMDCEKCWDTPCDCGWEYRDYPKDKRIKLAAAVLGIPSEMILETIGEEIPEKHPMYEED